MLLLGYLEIGYDLCSINSVKRGICNHCCIVVNSDYVNTIIYKEEIMNPMHNLIHHQSKELKSIYSIDFDFLSSKFA